MSDKIHRIDDREGLGIPGEDPRFGPRKLSDAGLAPARPHVAAADAMLERLRGLRQHHGLARLVEACEALRDTPAVAAVWQDRRPSTPARLASLVEQVAAPLEAIKASEARVDWEALGWKAEKPSELLAARIEAWQSPKARGRG